MILNIVGSIFEAKINENMMSKQTCNARSTPDLFFITSGSILVPFLVHFGVDFDSVWLQKLGLQRHLVSILAQFGSFGGVQGRSREMSPKWTVFSVPLGSILA